MFASEMITELSLQKSAQHIDFSRIMHNMLIQGDPNKNYPPLCGKKQNNVGT
jgi:hypothetical protein